jgi:hypothetical protein
MLRVFSPLFSLRESDDNTRSKAIDVGSPA